MTCPTCVSCNTSSLIDHILTNSTESSIIDCGMSNHQLIFCTRKVKRAKFNKHSNVFPRSLIRCTVTVFLRVLQKINFSNYECFSGIDVTYNNFLDKFMKVVNEIAPGDQIRIKACVSYFLSNFYFSPNDIPSKNTTNVFYFI